MTTLAELVDAAPAATAGQAVDIAYGPGGFRLVVELADPSAGASVVWHDITDYVAGWSIERGADTYGGRYRASVAVLELVTDDDEFAPWNEDTSGTFGTHVELGAGLLIRAGFIRVVGGVVVGHRPRFTNRVESWSDDTSARGRIRRHTIVSRDLLTELVNVPVASRSSENWYTRVNATITASGFPFGSNVFGAQLDSVSADILTLPARSASSNALAELDAACDPCGLMLYTNTKGQLVIRPQPGDTFHADAFTAGASGTEYTPNDTVPFSYLADVSGGLVGYASDGVQPPFGFDSSELGVVNRLVVTDTGTYDIQDSTSIARYGYRPRSVTWQADNDTVADDILTRLAYATVEARPLTTTVDVPGFMEYAAGIEYADPITIQHLTAEGDGRQVVTGEGYVRSITEQVFPSGLTGQLGWTMQIISDVDGIDGVPELNEVTSLTAVEAVTLQPFELADFVSLGAEPTAVVVSGNYAYVGGDGWVSSVDISTPTAMTVADTVTSTPTLDFISYLAVSGDYLFAVSSTQDTIISIDISDPTNMTVDDTLAGFDLPQGLAISGNYAYVPSFVADSLYSVDISTPTAMTLADTLTHTTNLDRPVRLLIDGNYAYVACESSKVTSVDISTPTAMTIADTVTVNFGDSGNSRADDLVKVGDDLIVVSKAVSGCVFSIDASTPTNMVMQEYVVTPDSVNEAWNNTDSIAVWNNYAIFTTGATDAIVMIDISDPTAITSNAYLEDTGPISGPGVSLESCRGVAVSGGYAFVCSAQDTVLTSVALATGSYGATNYTWSNPTQTITPTHTQVRGANNEIWEDRGYPLTEIDWGPSDRIQIRLIRRDANGVITNASPWLEASL